MRLTDLDPHWLTENGQNVGFVFKSPIKPDWWQTCFFSPGRKFMVCPDCQSTAEWDCPHSQLGLVRAAGIDSDNIQGCKRDCGWAVHGEMNFDTLSVTPSLDGSAGGLWHGFITNGEIVGGI